MRAWIEQPAAVRSGKPRQQSGLFAASHFAGRRVEESHQGIRRAEQVRTVVPHARLDQGTASADLSLRVRFFFGGRGRQAGKKPGGNPVPPTSPPPTAAARQGSGRDNQARGGRDRKMMDLRSTVHTYGVQIWAIFLALAWLCLCTSTVRVPSASRVVTAVLESSNDKRGWNGSTAKWQDMSSIRDTMPHAGVDDRAPPPI